MEKLLIICHSIRRLWVKENKGNSFVEEWIWISRYIRTNVFVSLFDLRKDQNLWFLFWIASSSIELLIESLI